MELRFVNADRRLASSVQWQVLTHRKQVDVSGGPIPGLARELAGDSRNNFSPLKECRTRIHRSTWVLIPWEKPILRLQCREIKGRERVTNLTPPPV
jgi:hypothetical protein